jgi:hypothetical protein
MHSCDVEIHGRLAESLSYLQLFEGFTTHDHPDSFHVVSVEFVEVKHWFGHLSSIYDKPWVVSTFSQTPQKTRIQRPGVFNSTLSDLSLLIMLTVLMGTLLAFGMHSWSSSLGLLPEGGGGR